MATAFRPMCLLFDTHTVESCERGITGSSFWIDYAEAKADMYKKFTNQYQDVVDKLKIKLEALSDEEDVYWIRSLKKELCRDEAAIKLHDAYNKIYLKLSEDLAEVDHAIHTEETDFKKSMKEFKKMKDDWEHLQTNLMEKNEKISHWLYKFEEFLSRGGVKSKEKTQEWMDKFEKVASEYDTLISTESLKRPELMEQSHDLEQKYRDKENKRLRMIASMWQNCLTSLQEHIEHFSAESNEVKAVKYAGRIDIGSIIQNNLKRETADYSEYEMSKIIISRNPQVDQFLRKQKEQEKAAENKGRTEDDGQGHEESTKRTRSKTRAKPTASENKETRTEKDEPGKNTDWAAVSGQGHEESTKTTRFKTRAKPTENIETRIEKDEPGKNSDWAVVSGQCHDNESTKRTGSNSRSKPAQNEEMRTEKDKPANNTDWAVVSGQGHDNESTKRTRSKSRGKPAQNEEIRTEQDVIEDKRRVDVHDHENPTKRTRSKIRTNPSQNEENRKKQGKVVEDKNRVNVKDEVESTKRTRTKIRTNPEQNGEKRTKLAKRNDAELSVESDVVQPFNQEDLVLEDIDDIPKADLPENIKPLPRPLPSIPCTSGLKPVNLSMTNTWVDSIASDHSETEDDAADNNGKHYYPGTLPKAFVPFKAKVLRKYKKERPVEMSVKRGDKVKVLLPADENGFVLASKKTTFHLQKKKGFVPISHLLPVDRQ